jgi:hypothetical protein
MKTKYELTFLKKFLTNDNKIEENKFIYFTYKNKGNYINKYKSIK